MDKVTIFAGGHPACADADDGHPGVLLPHQRNQLPSRRRRRTGKEEGELIEFALLTRRGRCSPIQT